MKLTVFVVNALVVLGSPITPNLPYKLRQYQRATGISETELLAIYQNHLSGQFVSDLDRHVFFVYSRSHSLWVIKKYFKNYSRYSFRKTWSIYSKISTDRHSDVHPVPFETELLNVEAAINAGVFLCTEPGYYHFSAGTSAAGLEWIGVEIIHNGRSAVFARWIVRTKIKFEYI